MSLGFLTESLGSAHDRESFSCGEKPLDAYLKQYARQDQKRKEATVFVMMEENGRVQGYYTLLALHILVDDFPQNFLKKLHLSSYPNKVATLVGRLVDQTHQGRRLGAQFFWIP